MNDQEGDAVRLLVVARQPFQLVEADLAGVDGLESARLVRRLKTAETALAESRANVLLVDTGFPQGRAFDAIAEAKGRDPDLAVLALTADPPPPDEVARATRAGSVGFVDVNAEPDELAQAVQAVHAGGAWFPPEESRAVLSAVADDLDVTTKERQSRLIGILVGLVPLAGAIAAVISLGWRRYLGNIGVRPVDLAVDTGARVIDVVYAALMLLGVLGPLLLVSSWLDLLRGSRLDRGPLAWLLARPRTAWFALASLVLAAGLLLAIGPDVALVFLVGPAVSLAILARALDLSDELPPALRMHRLAPTRVVVTAVVFLSFFLAVLAYETMVVGPDLRTDGAHGWIAPRVLGFRATPMRAFDVDAGGEAREVLYLGGNADLYVLVDPCNDDEVELVSVGATRLVVIDEVTC